MKQKEISFLGLFGQQNIGNDCTLQTIIYHASQYLPNVDLKCICSSPAEINSRHNIPTFPMWEVPYIVWPGKNNFLLKLIQKVLIQLPRELFHWMKAAKFVKNSYMLVVPGTGLLVDHTTGPFGFPYYVFKWSLIAKLCRCKLLIVSIGAGPIYHPLSRWFIKSALSLAGSRSYRDSFSKQYIESIGFETTNDPVYPDLAFSLPRTMLTESNNRDGQRPVIGVGVVDYNGPRSIQQRGGGEAAYRDYINKTITFITWLLEHKYTVLVLIGDVKYDSSVKQDLLELLDKRGLNHEEGQIINEPIHSLEQLLSQLANTDIVVSPRFHNIILALMLNKPVISLSHDKKFDSLMAGLELAEYCLSIENLDVDRLIDLFIKLEKNTENLKPSIKKKTEEYRRALGEQYKVIFNNV